MWRLYILNNYLNNIEYIKNEFILWPTNCSTYLKSSQTCDSFKDSHGLTVLHRNIKYNSFNCIFKTGYIWSFLSITTV